MRRWGSRSGSMPRARALTFRFCQESESETESQPESKSEEEGRIENRKGHADKPWRERGSISRIEALRHARPAQEQLQGRRNPDCGSRVRAEDPGVMGVDRENTKGSNGSGERLARGRTPRNKGPAADNPVWKALLAHEKASSLQEGADKSKEESERAQRMQMASGDGRDDSLRTTPRQILHCGDEHRAEGLPDCTTSSPCTVSCPILIFFLHFTDDCISQMIADESAGRG
jgi:hypothetical protein